MIHTIKNSGIGMSYSVKTQLDKIEGYMKNNVNNNLYGNKRYVNFIYKLYRLIESLKKESDKATEYYDNIAYKVNMLGVEFIYLTYSIQYIALSSEVVEKTLENRNTKFIGFRLRNFKGINNDNKTIIHDSNFISKKKVNDIISMITENVVKIQDDDMYYTFSICLKKIRGDIVTSSCITNLLNEVSNYIKFLDTYTKGYKIHLEYNIQDTISELSSLLNWCNYNIDNNMYNAKVIPELKLREKMDYMKHLINTLHSGIISEIERYIEIEDELYNEKRIDNHEEQRV